MSPRRSSLPPPLPPLRARPNSPLRFSSGRDWPACSLPPPTPGGGINTISKPSKPSIPAPPSSLPPPLPPLAPGRPRPSAFAPGSVRPDCSLPPPAPGGGFNYINSYLSTNYCVSAPPSPGRFFFPLLGHSPGSMPRYASAWPQASALAKVLRLAHTIKAIVNNT